MQVVDVIAEAKIIEAGYVDDVNAILARPAAATAGVEFTHYVAASVIPLARANAHQASRGP